MRWMTFGLLMLAVGAAPVAAQAPILTGLGGPEGLGTECLHRNDDSYSMPIDLRAAFPSGLRFFDQTHTQVFVNTNGNITFSGGVSQYTPSPFPVAMRPMIAPYWADVDIRTESCGTTSRGSACHNPADNGVWWHLEPGRMVVTWDDVGYYACHLDKRMRFQLILTAVPTCGAGATDFDVEFRFNRCEWETGDIGGSGGFGGTEAQSGFDAGNGVDFVMLPGSREAGISTAMCTGSNIDDPGVWRFQIRSGAVICPGAGADCETGLPGACGEGIMSCSGMGGTTCQPVVPASDESCDAIDNDCDGTVDEGDDLCTSATEVCDRGRCIETCFEGGCPEGQECTADGQCLDAGCDGVECPEGERCVAGVCGDACAGVSCPIGLSCRAGRCLDLCEGVECDPSCSACVGGECVPRCDSASAGCEAGQTCTDDGICVATACLGVTCVEGAVCLEGRGCVDACEGATCPSGEVCVEGRCQRDMPVAPAYPDAGDDGARDGDGGPSELGEMDAGASPLGEAGLIPPGPRGTECICSAPGASRAELPFAGLLLVGLALVTLRRRRA